MTTAVTIAILAVIVLFFVRQFVKASQSAPGEAGPDTTILPEPPTFLDRPRNEASRYRSWTPGPPETPTVLPPVATTDPALAGLRALDRVAESCIVLDITPDGREAMILHKDAGGENCVSIVDVPSGRATTTWRNICPPDWTDHFGEDACFSAASRRLILGWTKDGPYDDGGENVLIDLERRRVVRIYESTEGGAALGSAAISRDGRIAAGLCIYSKGQPAFDLENAEEASAETQTWGDYGDIVLAPGHIWPEMALAPEGRWLAFDQGEGEVRIMKLDAEPEDRSSLPAFNWPSFHEHMYVSCDDLPQSLDFDEAGERLLVAERDGGLMIADLATKDFRSLKPLAAAESDVETFVYDAVWLNGRDAALLRVARPEPKLVLVDLAAETATREWAFSEDMLAGLNISRTGEFVLVHSGSGMIHVLPLLDPSD